MPAPLLEEGFADQIANRVNDSFKTKLAQIETTKANLDKYISGSAQDSLEKDIQNLKSIFSTYVTSGGVANAVVQSGPNGAPPVAGSQPTIDDMIKKITDKMEAYKKSVNEELSKLRSNIIQSADVSQLSKTIAEKMKTVDDLKKDLETANDNLSTAYTRDAMMESKDQLVSYHQTWGFLRRPLKKWSIPVIIAVIIFISLLSFAGMLLMLPAADDLIQVSPSGLLSTAPVPEHVKQFVGHAQSTLMTKIINIAKSALIAKLLLIIKPLLSILPFAII
jgi:ABC-type transporter Mla subunit MlaD